MIEKLESLTATVKKEWEAFQKGNKAAGTRCRLACQEMKVLAQEIRVKVSAAKNN
jgi:hypothetical protein